MRQLKFFPSSSDCAISVKLRERDKREVRLLWNDKFNLEYNTSVAHLLQAFLKCMSRCSSGPKLLSSLVINRECALLWSLHALGTISFKSHFFFAFVKVAVAMQNIHQFFSNLTPPLMCLKLTLICCEDVPLFRNFPNSTASNRISQAWQDPWWCNPTQLLYEYTYCAQGKSCLSLHSLRKQTRKGTQEVVLLSSRLFTLSRSEESDMHIDDRDDRLSRALDLPRSKW